LKLFFSSMAKRPNMRARWSLVSLSSLWPVL
jgi:hypothetical protein